MDFNFETAASDTKQDEENEYQLTIEFTSLALTDESIRSVQVILLCGDLMSKLDMCKNERVSNDGDDGVQLDVEEGCDDNFCAAQKTFTIHSTPTNLAKKLSELSVAFALLATENHAALGNPMMVELSECFANAVKCKNIEKESLSKTFKIVACEECLLGEISVVITIAKDAANSERFRPFYEQSTAERRKFE